MPFLASAQTGTEASCPPGTYSLGEGSSGANVLAVQRFLTTQFNNFNRSYITGYFGPLTQDAVAEWQSEHNIISYGSPSTTGWGLVGPKTAAAMGLCGSDSAQASSTESASAFAPSVLTNLSSPAGSLLQSLQIQLKALELKIASIESVALSNTETPSNPALSVAQTSAGNGSTLAPTALGTFLSGTITSSGPTAALTGNAQTSLGATASSNIAPLTVTQPGSFNQTSGVSATANATVQVNATAQTTSSVPTATLTESDPYLYETDLTNLTVNPGDTVTNSWSSTNAKSWTSTYTASGCSNASLNTASPKQWYDNAGNPANTQSDSYSASALPFAGCTIDVTYTAYAGPNETGQSATATLHVVVNPVQTSDSAPAANLTLNGKTNLAVDPSTPVTAVWSSQNATSWASTYSASGCSNTALDASNAAWTVADNGNGTGGGNISAWAGCAITYNYVATNAAGQSATANATLQVNAATAPNVTSVTSPSAINVVFGTPISSVTLPSTMNVTMSDGSTLSAGVVWNSGSPAYNGTTPGTYRFTGTFTLPAGDTNSNNVTASLEVTVASPLSAKAVVFQLDQDFSNGIAWNGDSVGLQNAINALNPLRSKYEVYADVNTISASGGYLDSELDLLAKNGMPFVLDVYTSDGVSIGNLFPSDVYDLVHGQPLSLTTLQQYKQKYGSEFAGIRFMEVFALNDNVLAGISGCPSDTSYPCVGPTPSNPFYEKSMLEQFVSFASQNGMFALFMDTLPSPGQAADLRDVVSQYPNTVVVFYDNNMPLGAYTEATWQTDYQPFVAAGAKGFGLSDQAWLCSDEATCPASTLATWAVDAFKNGAMVVEFEPVWYFFDFPVGEMTPGTFDNYTANPAWANRGSATPNLNTIVNALDSQVATISSSANNAANLANVLTALQAALRQLVDL